MKVLDRILYSDIIEYESYIPSFSKIIGKTFGNIENEFDIKIEHYHNSPITIDTRKKSNPDIVVKCGMSLKILGLPRNINELREAYNLP
ncbi:MAG: hypothetical protein WC578_07040 [Candidatus Omnitrophota bacterium]|jgi:hypothetical protein